MELFMTSQEFPANLQSKFFRIGETETRKNIFLLEREVKNALFKSGSSPSPSRTASVDKYISTGRNLSPTKANYLNTDLIINK